MQREEKNEQYWLARLYDRNPESRVQAAKYFWGQKALSATVRQALLGTLQDQDPMVREWGIMALTRVTGPAGPLQAKLLDLLRDSRGDVRWNAVAIVDRLKMASTEIVGQLQAMLEDEDPIVRRFVERALRRLKRQSARAPAASREERDRQLPLFEVTWLERLESKEERILQVFREVITERTDDEQLRHLVAGRMGLPPEQAARIVDTILAEATRVVRDRQVVAEAIAERGSDCQIDGCGFSFATERGRYAEGVYLPPPGRAPRRVERSSYVLILCPNHHKMLELSQTRKLHWDDEQGRIDEVELNGETFAVRW